MKKWIEMDFITIKLFSLSAVKNGGILALLAALLNHDN